MTDRARVISVVAGVGDHADPWHALEATAEALATLLAPLGDVRLSTTEVEPAWDDTVLLVLVVSGDLAVAPAASRRFVDAVDAHHRAGRPLLAVHSSTLAFRDDPRWHDILGGHWVPGVSMHPQIGHALVQSTRPPPDVAPGLVPFEADFVLYDERYSFLEVADDATILARHTEDGRTHALVWGRPSSGGRGAVVYDGLGHGVESFASPPHARWLAETARALLGGDREGVSE